MNVGQSQFSAKTQIQTDTPKKDGSTVDDFTGQLVAAQIGLTYTGGKTSEMDVSQELFEDKRSKKQIEQEKVEESLVSTYVVDHKIIQSKEQNHWSNDFAQHLVHERKMTNQSAELHFNKGIDEVQGRVADKIAKQKLMAQRGRLFNPALAQEAVDSVSSSTFTEKSAQIPPDKPTSNLSYSSNLDPKMGAESMGQQKQNLQQQLEAMQSPTQTNQARVASLSKVGAAELIGGVMPIAKQGIKSSSPLAQRGADTPGLDLTSVKVGQERDGNVKSAKATEAPAQKYTSQLEVKHLGQNIKMMLNAKKTQLTMILKPEHLGKVEIKLKKDGDLLQGQMKVDSVEAKEAMERVLPELKENLQAQGFKVDEFTIDIQEQTQNSFAQAGNQGGTSTGQGAQHAFSQTEARSFEPTLTEDTAQKARQPVENDNLSIYA